MAFSDDFLRELSDRSPIEEIAAPYVELRRRGKNLVGLCPFHNEKTPSFNLYPENNSFFCFGCNKGGSVFDFVMGVENLAFPDAVRQLAQRAGMPVPEDGADDSMNRLRTRILEINRESGRFFYRTLMAPQGKPGLDYFRARGLDDRTIRHFGLGYAPDAGFALTNHLRDKGYTPSELQSSDMVRLSKSGNLYDRYRGRVMFPIFDVRGNVVAFGGRILTDEKPKYLNTSDTPVYHKSSGLFALNFAKDSGARRLILAEGYMDVIALHRAGFTEAIATLGTALTEEQARIMRRYAQEVVLCYDSDAAGQRATQRAIPLLKNAGLRVRVVVVPGNKDPDEFFRTSGPDGPARFRQLLEAGGNDTEYELSRLAAALDLTTDDGRTQYLRQAVESVLWRLEPMERDVYAGRLSQETGVSRDNILDATGKAAARQRRRREKELVRAQQPAVVAGGGKSTQGSVRQLRTTQSEEGLIAFLFRSQERAADLLALCPPETFLTPENRVLYQGLLAQITGSPGPVNLPELSQRFSGEEMSRLTSLLTRRQELTPSWKDAQEFSQVLREERDKLTLKDATPEQIKERFALKARQHRARDRQDDSA